MTDERRIDLLRELEGLRGRSVIAWAGATKTPAGLDHSTFLREWLAQLAALPEGNAVDLLLLGGAGKLGAVRWAIAVLRERFSTVSAIVPAELTDAGALLALGCNDLVMSRTATFGPVDLEVFEDCSCVTGTIEHLLLHHMKRGERRHKAADVARRLADTHFPQRDILARSLVKETGLGVTVPKPEIEDILDRLRFELDEALESSRLRPRDVLAADKRCRSLLFEHVPIASLPANLGAEARRQAESKVAGEVVIDVVPAVQTTTVHALLESPRRKARYVRTAWAAGVRLPNLELRESSVVESEGWEAIV